MKGASCRFIGRLANNMFQLAAVIGYATMYNVRWFAPSTNREAPRFYEFFPKVPTGRSMYEDYEAHDGSDFNYIRIPMKPGGINLVGFFQSLKYFEHCQDLVKEMFELKTESGYEDFVSIHVRRGDYIFYSADFPPITMDYINQALEHFPNKKIFVTSDDTEWCRQNIKSDNYIEFTEGRNEYENMSVMASCGDHIIANSSFSWWGAYLGINPDRKIVCPHYMSWFGKNNGVMKSGTIPTDLIPDGWLQIRFR